MEKTIDKDKITWEIPLKTVSEANCSEHWSKKAKRHKMQQFFIRSAFVRQPVPIQRPYQITLTRLSSRLLDGEENLPMAFKWIKDEIGACLFPEKVVVYLSKSGKLTQNKGHADSYPGLKWVYRQEKSKRMGIRVEFESLDPSPQS